MRNIARKNYNEIKGRLFFINFDFFYSFTIRSKKNSPFRQVK